MDWLTLVILLNGGYDVACAISILFLYDFSPVFSALAHLHLSIFNKEKQPLLAHRLLAYWILTYGAVRLVPGQDVVVMVSYGVEAAAYAYEALVVGDTVPWRVAVVVLLSVLLICLLVLRVTGAVVFSI